MPESPGEAVNVEAAFAWVNQHRGVVRFFHEPHTGEEKLRISIPLGDEREPITVILPIRTADRSGMGTFVTAVEDLRLRCEALDRRRQLRVV